MARVFATTSAWFMSRMNSLDSTQCLVPFCRCVTLACALSVHARFPTRTAATATAGWSWPLSRRQWSSRLYVAYMYMRRDAEFLAAWLCCPNSIGLMSWSRKPNRDSLGTWPSLWCYHRASLVRRAIDTTVWIGRGPMLPQRHERAASSAQKRRLCAK